MRRALACLALIAAVMPSSVAARPTSVPVHACGPLHDITIIWRVDQRFTTYSKIDGYLSGIGAVAGLRFRGIITVPPASHIQELDLWFDAFRPGRQIYTEAVLYSRHNSLIWLAFMDTNLTSSPMVKVPCRQ